MRLIDADALKAKIETAGGEGTIANYCRRVMANCLDNDAPTVDAIPQEWMREKLEYLAGEPISVELMAVATVLGMWEKEREQEGEYEQDSGMCANT